VARKDTAPEIDWTQCELIEQIPGKVSGRPIVRGTRILPDAIVNSLATTRAVRRTTSTRTIRGFPFHKSRGSSNSPTFSAGSLFREGASR
jgi:hypothetical protein